ncbi:MAG TPA: SHOCT domain-containing protein, partial [Candidatus Dormibacteraeota bacterium]|nr:SHOCT domain-containing protein [Candidatus Dormibacteraeota bacterium]
YGLLAHELQGTLSPILRHYPERQGVESEAVSSIDRIRQLAELRDAGVLTEAEFQSKKTDLLSRL